MRDHDDVFHLAIPAADLDAAQDFYVTGLGCKLARRYADRITLDFFGDQVVCHLSDRVDEAPELYPRHFGVTFRRREDWERLLRLARTRGLSFFAEPFHRFAGRAEEHESFVLADPSNNLLEFKYYDDPRMMY
ncbi:VOC family protein [Pseudonocardia alaniniphila]|uniref:VOC family protein n=1 Tax=Pseudonocardia alaniniphila TaxID=75291 RepID=A0ABS9TC87_9PSEU|nr:VOC family protein [Pseudonocardia alaniniphila]MCH6166160.1 VOC family protein [Pseudonocardia alaniniphila]